MAVRREIPDCRRRTYADLVRPVPGAPGPAPYAGGSGRAYLAAPVDRVRVHAERDPIAAISARAGLHPPASLAVERRDSVRAGRGRKIWAGNHTPVRGHRHHVFYFPVP